MSRETGWRKKEVDGGATATTPNAIVRWERMEVYADLQCAATFHDK